MKSERRSPLTRFLATSLCAALILTAPGLPFYKALAAETVDGEGAAPGSYGEVTGIAPTGAQTPVVSAANPNAVTVGGSRGLDLRGAMHTDAAGNAGSWESGFAGETHAPGTLDSEAAPSEKAAALVSVTGSGLGAANGVMGDAFPTYTIVHRTYDVRRNIARLSDYFKNLAHGVLAGASVVQAPGVAHGGLRELKVPRASSSSAAAPKAQAAAVNAYYGDPFESSGSQSSLSPMAVAGKGAEKDPPLPPAPNKPSDGQQPPNNGGSFKSAAWFVASMFIAQIGLEAWGAYSGKWTQDAYGSGHYSTLSMLSMFASLVSGYIGGVVADKMGMKRSYVISGLLTAASAGALLILFGMMHPFPFWAFTALTLARMVIGGVAGTVRQTLPIAIFGGDQDKLNSFNSSTQFLLEIPGIVVPLFIGTILTWFGTLGAMSLMPITGAAAILMVAFLVKVNEGAAKDQTPGTPAEQRKTDPYLLKWASIGYVGFVLLNYMLYQIIALSYGNFLHPGTSAVEQAASAAVSGRITGFYSAGGLIAAVFLSGALTTAWSWLRKTKWGAALENRLAQTRLGKWIAAKLAASQASEASQTPEQKEAGQRKSIARWMRIGALGLLGFVPFIWTNATLTAVAMIPFGATSVVGQLKLMSLAQAQTPIEKSGKVMGMISAVSTLTAIGGLFGFSYLVDHGAALAKMLPFLAAAHLAAGAIPFALLLAFMVLLGLSYVWVGRKLQNYTPTQTPPKK